MIVIVVLAAGGSSRFGSPKQQARLQGSTLTEIALRTALAAGADGVLLVTGAHADVTLLALDSLPPAQRQQVRVVHNAAWALGQASSVQAAIRALAADTGAVVIMPVDQPRLSASVLQSLIACWRKGALLAAPTVDGKMRGAPALFAKDLFSELLALQGDTGGRVILQRYAERVVTIEVSAQELVDVDTPEGLNALSGAAPE